MFLLKLLGKRHNKNGYVKVIRIKYAIAALTVFFAIMGATLGVVMNRCVICSVTGDDELQGTKLPVIMYHGFTETPSKCGEYVVLASQFENDIKYLLDNGYTFISTDDLKNYMYADGTLPKKPAMITIDDGFYNNYLYAYPIICKYKIKAIISPIAKVSDIYTQTPDLNPAYANLSWNTINEMSQSGLIFFENHTYNMHSLLGRRGCSKNKTESIDQYQKLLYADLSHADELIKQHTGRKPVAMTYPFGSTSKEAYDVITKLGYVMSFSCTEGMNYITQNPKSLFMLKRCNRISGPSSAEFFSKIPDFDK